MSDRIEPITPANALGRFEAIVHPIVAEQNRLASMWLGTSRVESGVAARAIRLNRWRFASLTGLTIGLALLVAGGVVVVRRRSLGIGLMVGGASGAALCAGILLCQRHDRANANMANRDEAARKVRHQQMRQAQSKQYEVINQCTEKLSAYQQTLQEAYAQAADRQTWRPAIDQIWAQWEATRLKGFAPEFGEALQAMRN